LFNDTQRTGRGRGQRRRGGHQGGRTSERPGDFLVHDAERLTISDKDEHKEETAKEGDKVTPTEKHVRKYQIIH
jgi:hypothetical protein